MDPVPYFLRKIYRVLIRLVPLLPYEMSNSWQGHREFVTRLRG